MNVVKDTLQVSTLITVMGTESYEWIVNLCTPVKPKNKTFQQVVDIMERHLQTCQRFKLVGHRMQCRELYNTWLRSRSVWKKVCGIRQRLFVESKLDFAKVSLQFSAQFGSSYKDESIESREKSSNTSLWTCGGSETARETALRGDPGAHRLRPRSPGSGGGLHRCAVKLWGL